MLAPASIGYKEFLPFILMALLVTLGSYLHAVRRKIAGFVIVLLAGGLVSFIGIAGTTVVIFYSNNFIVVLAYLSGVTAFITVVASIITQFKRRRRIA